MQRNTKVPRTFGPPPALPNTTGRRPGRQVGNGGPKRATNGRKGHRIQTAAEVELSERLRKNASMLAHFRHINDPQAVGGGLVESASLGVELARTQMNGSTRNQRENHKAAIRTLEKARDAMAEWELLGMPQGVDSSTPINQLAIPIHSHLGIAQSRVGNFPEAYASFQLAMEHGWQDAEAFAEVSGCLLGMKKYDDARAYSLLGSERAIVEEGEGGNSEASLMRALNELHFAQAMRGIFFEGLESNPQSNGVSEQSVHSLLNHFSTAHSTATNSLGPEHPTTKRISQELNSLGHELEELLVKLQQPHVLQSGSVQARTSLLGRDTGVHLPRPVPPPRDPAAAPRPSRYSQAARSFAPEAKIPVAVPRAPGPDPRIDPPISPPKRVEQGGSPIAAEPECLAIGEDPELTRTLESMEKDKWAREAEALAACAPIEEEVVEEVAEEVIPPVPSWTDIPDESRCLSGDEGGEGEKWEEMEISQVHDEVGDPSPPANQAPSPKPDTQPEQVPGPEPEREPAPPPVPVAPQKFAQQEVVPERAAPPRSPPRRAPSPVDITPLVLELEEEEWSGRMGVALDWERGVRDLNQDWEQVRTASYFRMNVRALVDQEMVTRMNHAELQGYEYDNIANLAEEEGGAISLREAERQAWAEEREAEMEQLWSQEQQGRAAVWEEDHLWAEDMQGLIASFSILARQQYWEVQKMGQKERLERQGRVRDEFAQWHTLVSGFVQHCGVIEQALILRERNHRNPTPPSSTSCPEPTHLPGGVHPPKSDAIPAPPPFPVSPPISPPTQSDSFPAPISATDVAYAAPPAAQKVQRSAAPPPPPVPAAAANNAAGSAPASAPGSHEGGAPSSYTATTAPVTPPPDAAPAPYPKSPEMPPQVEDGVGPLELKRREILDKLILLPTPKAIQVAMGDLAAKNPKAVEKDAEGSYVGIRLDGLDAEELDEVDQLLQNAIDAGEPAPKQMEREEAEAVMQNAAMLPEDAQVRLVGLVTEHAPQAIVENNGEMGIDMALLTQEQLATIEEAMGVKLH